MKSIYGHRQPVQFLPPLTDQPLVQVPKRGILKQSTSFEQRERSEEKTRWQLKKALAV